MESEPEKTLELETWHKKTGPFNRTVRGEVKLQFKDLGERLSCRMGLE